MLRGVILKPHNILKVLWTLQGKLQDIQSNENNMFFDENSYIYVNNLFEILCKKNPYNILY